MRYHEMVEIIRQAEYESWVLSRVHREYNNGSIESERVFGGSRAMANLLALLDLDPIPSPPKGK